MGDNMIFYAGSVGTPSILGKNPSKGSISGTGEGVYTLEWNNGKVAPKSVQYADNAGIICISKSKRYLYAANESKDFGGLNGSGGGVTAYRIAEDGTLSKINDSISYGSRTSYVTVTDNGKFLIASNHGSHTTVTCHYTQNENGEWELQRGFDDSSVAVFKLRDDGGIDCLSDLKIFDGHGYWNMGGGQSTSHLHSVKAKGNLIVAGNRGADRIEIMHLDEKTGKLTVLNRYHTKPAFAPRHSDYHPFADIWYVVNENYPVLSVYSIDPKDGRVELLQEIKTMPKSYYEKNPLPNYQKLEADKGEKNTSGMADFSLIMPSDVHVSHDGKYVWAANRSFKNGGSIISYKVNDDYTLTEINWMEIDGGDPRGFNITDDDKFLVVGICDKNKVDIYKLENGIPSTLISSSCIHSPASIAFYK